MVQMLMFTVLSKKLVSKKLTITEYLLMLMPPPMLLNLPLALPMPLLLLHQKHLLLLNLYYLGLKLLGLLVTISLE
jgi:hypothetical protein